MKKKEAERRNWLKMNNKEDERKEAEDEKEGG
jgi:hypothetical protein